MDRKQCIRSFGASLSCLLVVIVSGSLLTMWFDEEAMPRLLAKVTTKTDNPSPTTNESGNFLNMTACPISTPLPHLLSGPGAPFYQKQPDNVHLVFPTKNESRAVCEFLNQGHFSWHFPHAMQQLLRCFSWWQANPHQWSILIKPPFDKVNKYMRVRMNYTDEFLLAMEKAFGVMILRDKKPYRRLRKIAVSKLISGAAGDQPYAMHSQSDAETLRRGIAKYLHLDIDNNNGCSASTEASRRRPRIGFLNRNNARHVLNHESILEVLQQQHATKTATTTTIHYLDSFDDMPFAQQVAWMSKIDILVSPHGAQLTSVPYIPECGGVLELFPKGYFARNYFGSLAISTGHHHATIYTGNITNVTAETAYDPPKEQMYGKHSQFEVDPLVTAEGVEQLVQKWHTCCNARVVENVESSSGQEGAGAIQQ